MYSSCRKYKRGQFLIIVAVALVVLIGFVGLAIDAGRGYGVKAKLNAAVDAAAIAGARALAEGDTDAARIAATQTAAQNYYTANYPASYLGSVLGPLTVDAVHDARGYWIVTVNGSATLSVTLMRVLGANDTTVAADGQAIRRDLDIILVLDTSGSLGPPTSSSSTLPTLKAAAVNFVNKFNAGTNGDRVGLVSFASGGVVDVPIVKDGTRGFTRTQVVTAINALTVTGATASAEGMRLALNEINGVPAVNRSSLRMIVFFSDGAPNEVPATFCRGTVRTDGTCNGTLAAVDLYSETSGPGTSRATSVFRYDRRDVSLGDYSNIATLPNSGFTVTGVGDIALAGYNGKRTLALTGSPARYTNTRCNVNKAARNMVENVANTARSQTIKIYSLALGASVTQQEITFCSYGASESGSSILNRLANTTSSDTYNAAQPSGLYVWAATDSELNNAFSTIASEILRLSR